MPIYVYKNMTTGETFELQQSIKDDALTIDPMTGDPVTRLIQPVGIAFKGSGFYVNDSKSNNPVSKQKASEATETSTDSSSTADTSPVKSETKTESQKEAKPATTPKTTQAKAKDKPKAKSN